MKKITLFLMISILLPILLVSCKKTEYKPVESTEEELQTVMTLTFDDKTYEVKYELYRALFLSQKSSIDGGDSSVWSGENKEEYIKLADALVAEEASEIYGAFYVCEKIGVDVYSDSFEKAIKKMITLSVDGGYDEISGQELVGFEGDYDKYLESLKKMNINYSVQTLMIRYSLALEEIYKHYIGTLEGDTVTQGAITYTDEEIKSFYFGQECVNVMRAFFPIENYKSTRVKELRDKMSKMAEEGTEAFLNYTYGILPIGSDLGDGEIIAKSNLDPEYYSELTKIAFSLPVSSVSEPIEVITGYTDGYHILYKLEKSEQFFTNNKTHITSVYLENEIAKILNNAARGLTDGAKNESVLDSIDRASISME